MCVLGPKNFKNIKHTLSFCFVAIYYMYMTNAFEDVLYLCIH